MLRELTLNEMEIVSGGDAPNPTEWTDPLEGNEINFFNQTNMYLSQFNIALSYGEGGSGDEIVVTGSQTGSSSSGSGGWDPNSGIYYDRSGHSHLNPDECLNHHATDGGQIGAAVGAIAGAIFGAGIGGLAGGLFGGWIGLVGGAANGLHQCPGSGAIGVS